MRCTLTQVKSIPQSDIDVDIWGVRWGATGMEFCGCIGHNDLPDVIKTTISSDKTTLSYIHVPLNHKRFYYGHKHVMREEWQEILLELINEIAHSNIKQHTLF